MKDALQSESGKWVAKLPVITYANFRGGTELDHPARRLGCIRGDLHGCSRGCWCCQAAVKIKPLIQELDLGFDESGGQSRKYSVCEPDCPASQWNMAQPKKPSLGNGGENRTLQTPTHPQVPLLVSKPASARPSMRSGEVGGSVGEVCLASTPSLASFLL